MTTPRNTDRNTDHDDGPFHNALNRAPKPGVPLGLLVWVVVSVAITFGFSVFLAVLYWK